MPIRNVPRIAICLLTSIALFSGCSNSGESSDQQEIVATASIGKAPAGRLGNSVVPIRYRLELKIDPTAETFSGVVEIDVMVNEPRSGIWLHGKDLDVKDAWLTDSQSNRVDATFQQRLQSGVALLALTRRVEPGPATLHLHYSGTFNRAANGLFKVVRGDESYAATQFESIAARQAFPGFDEPGFKVPFDLTVIAREGEVAITNTPEASAERLGDGFVKHVFDTTRPLPTYLLAFAVGPYDLVDYGMIPANPVRKREVHLRGLTARGLGSRIDYALKNTDGILSELEDYFGTPYPYKKLDLIAVPESFGGAMENPGAITYDEYLVLMDEESSARQRRAYTSVHAHELAHMWFGDLVTPVWWNDIWLNESFASWMMNKAADGYWPEGEFDREALKGALGAMAGDSLASARQIREPIEDNDNISNAFDGITYQKGGGVLAMLERYVGADRFQAGVRLHLARHADSTATAEDFIASLAEGSERAEIAAAFESYIEQPGVPLISVALNCDDGKNPTLDVSQRRYAPLGSSINPDSGQWHIPMCVSYLAGGNLKSSCTLLSELEQSIKLDVDSCPTRVLPNADGAGYYRFSLDSAGWSSLISDASKLPATEALAAADSLDAAFRAGEVSAETWLLGMAALVNHDVWDVADAATDYLEQITEIIQPGQLAPVEQAFQDIVRPRFAALGDATDPGSALLRQRMQRFLIVTAKDQAMRDPLAQQAAARIGLDGDPDPSAVDQSELETVFSVGVQDIGEPFFDLLLKQAIVSEDPAFRGSAIGALSRVEDPALVSKLQTVLLAGEFKGTEFGRIINRQMFRAATTELTYAWIKDNDEAIFELIPQSFRTRAVTGVGSAFCTAERAEEWQAFVRSKADKLPGFERGLAQATERIRLCAALRESKAAELLAAFGNYSL
jgi:aminopeptidase N